MEPELPAHVADSDTGKLCPDEEQVLLEVPCSRSCAEPRPTTKASQTSSGQPSDVSAFGFLQGQVALSWSLQPCSSPCTYTRRGHEPQSVRPVDLSVISRNAMKSPCKLHGFATFFPAADDLFQPKMSLIL